ncbi:MAG: TIGR03617 family F420-dependent LLM class oxidoreductase, partial [Acidimicrobiia bacterium]|nr:TIGR03617 family F420-dependent LLM class oxidoreductase [Acidimicrobiia bacterium]
MELDARLNPGPSSVAERAQRLEAAGYTRAWTHEERHDPFVALGLAATTTERLELGTNIAVAFARSPMTTAHTAWDLQMLSQGRFILGLGAQIKGHVTRRFSMPWSRPAARMQEYVEALHAIWDTWEHGTKLDFRGDFYEHTITRAMFIPPRHPFGRPRIHLAAVGPLMTRVAGSVADGLLCHSFTTADYLRDVTLPNLRAAADAAG